MDSKVIGTHTVRDVLREAHKLFPRYGRTAEQVAFQGRLLALTSKRRTKTSRECSDIDATAFLTDEEFDSLIVEARSLAP